MPKREPTDLRGRRTDLAITVLDMATGIGAGPGVVSAIEDGTATDAERNLYATWLSRIEGWSQLERDAQVSGARFGRRFVQPQAFRR
jgi:hypothetical protein